MKVIIHSKFPQVKPAHHAYISKQGEGGTLKVAIRDAVTNLFDDERLHGKRTSSLLPAVMTVQLIPEVDDDGE